MTTQNNKYLFNLKNVHYAVTTVNEAGETSFSAVKRLPGTTKLTMELEQSQENNYSEGQVYFVTTTTAGYKGELTIYNVDPEFEKDVLGFKADSKGVVYEQTTLQPKEIALLFEIEGNGKPERHVMYRLQLTKPKFEFSTTTDKTEAVNLEMEYTGLSDENGIGRAKTNAATDAETYNNWFKSVYKVTEAGTAAAAQSGTSRR